jgi:PAS domain-containing protein
VFGEAQRGRADGTWTVSVAEPVLDAAGGVRAVVIGTIHLRDLTRSLTATPLPPGATATLVDRRGHVLAQAGEAAVGIGERAPHLATLATASGEGTAHLPASATAGARLVGHAPVRGLGWRVLVSVDEATALAPVRQSMLDDALAGLAAVLAAMMLGGLTARSLATPVDGLVRDAQALAAGDFARRSDPDAPGELGTLAAAFNDMAATLAARTAALHRSERRYRTLFDASPLPMYLADLTTHEFLAVNDACVAQYGWTREEFLQRTLLDIRPPTDRAKFLAVARSWPSRSAPPTA